MIEQKSKFLEELINPSKKTAKSANKYFTVKTQSNLSALLAVAISTLIGSEGEDSALKSLDNLDPSQVWAMIENISKDSQNHVKKIGSENAIKPVVKELKEASMALEFLNKKTNRKENEKVEDEEGDDIDGEEEEDLNGEEEENLDEGEEEEFGKGDRFFNFQDLNKFADEGLEDDDQKEKNPEDELEDDEEGNLDPKKAEEEKEYKYDDFFDAPDTKGKGLRKVNKLSEGAEEFNDEYLEDDIFDIENKMMKNKKEAIEEKFEFINPDQQMTIEEIEKKMMADKQWNMKGEVTSRERPKGSLVENFLDFETSVKPPPIPTPEYTNKIEQIILLRIKDELFDDPIRRTVGASRKNEVELDFNKNKKGLAEIYEEEYEKNVLKLTGDTEISAAKKEIDDLCAKIYTIFDKLTNNNFISGARHTEMKVLTNVPSIQLEEISNYVTDNKSNTKSANEVFSRKDAEVKTRDELTREEKKTAHKSWKRNIRNRIREKVRNQKLNHLSKFTDTKFEAKLTMKQEKDKKMKQNAKNSELKSSKFFSNLQQIATDDINKKKRRETGETDFGVTGNKPAKNYKL
jgi:U3 small nucleolar RNA-associated protein MPP10